MFLGLKKNFQATRISIQASEVKILNFKNSIFSLLRPRSKFWSLESFASYQSLEHNFQVSSIYLEKCARNVIVCIFAILKCNNFDQEQHFSILKKILVADILLYSLSRNNIKSDNRPKTLPAPLKLKLSYIAGIFLFTAIISALLFSANFKILFTFKPLDYGHC